MTERSIVNTKFQIGVETVPGTSTTCNKRFASLDCRLTPQFDTKIGRGIGNELNALAQVNKEWVSADINGIPTYDELTYLLSSVLCTGVPTIVSAGPYYKWVFTPNLAGIDTPITYTVEWASAEYGNKFAYGLVTGISFDFSRDGVTVKANMIGRAVTFPATPSVATTLAHVPITGADMSLYLDPAWANLGTSKIGNFVRGSVGLADRWGPFWVMDNALASWQGHVKLAPKTSVKMVVEADAAGLAQLTALRAGTKQYMRLCTPGTIGTTAAYLMAFDCGVVFSGVDQLDESEGVVIIGLTGEMCQDATPSGLQVTLHNKLVTL